jgi:hypothetical protein
MPDCTVRQADLVHHAAWRRVSGAVAPLRGQRPALQHASPVGASPNQQTGRGSAHELTPGPAPHDSKY